MNPARPGDTISGLTGEYPRGSGLDEFADDWTRLDSELYALADRIRLARGSGGDVWRLRVVFSTTSPVSGHDFRVWGEQVLPRSSRHRCIEVITEFDRRVGQIEF